MKRCLQLAGPLQTNRLYHFCIFSDNVMAVAAVVKSTVTSSKDPTSLLFHIVTDAITEKAMQVKNMDADKTRHDFLYFSPQNYASCVSRLLKNNSLMTRTCLLACWELWDLP